MKTLPGTRRVERGQLHEYYIDNIKVIGVTTVINSGIPKPALIAWSGNTVSEYAVDNWPRLGKLPPSKRLKELKGAPFANRDEAGKQGTKIHQIAERLVKGETVETIPVGLDPYIQSAKAFLSDWEIELVASELPVFSRRHMYGGTIDLIGRASNLTYLFDFKSNRSGVYPDASIQTVAYRFADFYLDSNGNETPLPEIDRCAVVHIRQDGYSVYEVDEMEIESIYKIFLHAKGVALGLRDSAGFLAEVERI